MMNEWVLIIAMFSPGGGFIDKYAEGPIATKAECVSRQQALKTTGVQVHLKGVCVTKDHWEGKKQMIDVAYD
jgi:hypothetical protein